MLRVCDLGFARGIAEKGRIEEINSLDNRPCLRRSSGRRTRSWSAPAADFLRTEETNGADSRYQVRPERLDGRSIRKPTRHPDDRNSSHVSCAAACGTELFTNDLG